ncbi:glycosyltransferase family 4 protein [Rhodothermus profundi]|uniref:Glycosyltransferase involved in cell wall bisynthesis n=1 Tax=Rhodothermus profundi TaxID=633813 RepID=A0A1M6RDB1_9BACT|nr:glycosyltransferase family 1 protein [Rhodothermus profundi]SHK30338.1 Glycosyltransferase involved in cell wall bisynthesis [Rhodothermus profundi]
MQTPAIIDCSKAPAGPRLVAPRIALFTGAYNHIADGVSRTLNRLVGYLEQRGASVLVFAPTVPNPPVRHEGTLVPVPSIPVPGRPEYRISLGLTRRHRRLLATFEPDLIHIATPDLLGFQALRLARRQGIPVVASYHTHFSAYLKYYHLQWSERLLWSYLRWFYGQCQQIYVPSTSMIDILRAHGIRHNLYLWERGVDTNLFNPAQRSYAWRRNVLGVADHEVIVAYVGRLVWEKGLNVLAATIDRLRQAHVPFRCLIVGEGPARRELEARLPTAIFTGYLEGRELARAYASADVFFFPSETETFGNVTLEAMASGLPAVCADAPGSNMLIEHGRTGFLATPGHVEEFAGYLRRLILSVDLRRTMGRYALQRARHFDWEAVLNRLYGYYLDVLAPALQPAGDGAATELPELTATAA